MHENAEERENKTTDAEVVSLDSFRKS